MFFLQFDESMIVFDACRLIRDRVPDAAQGQRMSHTHTNSHTPHTYHHTQHTIVPDPRVTYIVFVYLMHKQLTTTGKHRLKPCSCRLLWLNMNLLVALISPPFVKTSREMLGNIGLH